MNHFEAFTCAKDPLRPQTNEDQIVARAGMVYAVIDGATDISGDRFDDMLGTNATGGSLAARAVARALADWSDEYADTPPDPDCLLRDMNAAIAALHHRVGRADLALENGANRFRVTFAGAFVWRDGVRLIRVGDSGFRVNGQIALEYHFPADAILSAARSSAWHLLAARGIPEADIRQAARLLIVHGLADQKAAVDLGFSEADLANITDAVLSKADVMATVDRETDKARAILAGGLRTVRADPGAVGAIVLDGVSDLTGTTATADFAQDDIETLEIFSDGYPALPEAVEIAAWEKALKEVDQTDPNRIGRFASTKGCDQGRFGDDRSIIIVRNGVAP